MILKQLTVQGYKTFASKTEFVFDEGITAIVGPNGSGKSNIADALRWVLGEQSYGMLRGKRTTDMIFAGSESRARAGMAQVSLRLDNTTKWLPIDYSEVEIGRRAHRSGENEYLLNGQKVRLKDIDDLLATSGLSERTYTIIGQGLIDQALSLRSDERRALFEEAAGINHYKSRRSETLRRLQETQHNLERVYDILEEIRPRLVSLKRQATRAKNYEQVHQDLRQLLRIWYGYKWEQAKRELRRARAEAATAERAWQAARKELLAGQAEMETWQQALDEGQQRVAQLRTVREEAGERLSQAQRESAIAGERRAAIMNQISEIEAELPLLQAQRSQAEGSLAEASGELRAAQLAFQEARVARDRFQSTFREQQREIRHWQDALSSAQSERQRRQKQLAQAEGQLSQLQERLAERRNIADGQEERELERLQGELERYRANLQGLQQQGRAYHAQREAVQQKRQALVRDLKERRREARELQENLRQAQDRLARREARLEMLQQAALPEISAGPAVALRGRLASLISIPPEQRTALEAALGARLETLVVEDEDSLWRLVADNTQKSLLAAALPRAGLPAVERRSVPAGDHVTGSSVVKCAPDLRPLVDLIFGGVLLVRDHRAAYDLAAALPGGDLAVAPDGFVVYGGGLVQTSGEDAAAGAIAQEEARRDAEAALVAARNALHNLESENSAAQAAVQAQQDEADELQNTERQLTRQEAENLQRLAEEQRRLDRSGQQELFHRRQIADRTSEESRLRERLQALETRLAAEREGLTQAEADFADARARLEALPVAEAGQQQAALQQNHAAAETILAGRQAVADSRRATLQQVEQQRLRLQNRLETLRAQATELEDAASAHALQTLLDERAGLDNQLANLQEEVAGSRARWQELQRRAAAGQRQAHDLENQYTVAQVRFTQQQNLVAGLQERIRADLGLVALEYDDDQTGAPPLPIHDVVDQLPAVRELPPDIDEAIHISRGQLQRMGGVNPDAPAEYEATQARFEFLTQQVGDLEETEKQLRHVIAELDELTSRAFASTVEQVNRVFGDIFTQLFGGGSARLALTDPDDLTITGVDIVARLPNRREQGLALLSGGERSLTASALIFSLLKVAPTPFCVLDEVDAALDEANIGRFRDLLRELSLKTQFVVITHNRGTVQAAQTVYGVSMLPDSASQVISIRPEDYLRQPALV
jgi:chromosome segregation protein